MISLEKIKKSFDNKKVISNIDFACEKGEFVTLFGPNGCGKSTLINILLDQTKADGGKITNHAQKIGYVFQNYRESLLPWMSVKDNILFPLKIKNISLDECEAKLKALLKITKLKLPTETNINNLSGGQAQLVTLLRALIIEPDLLILDEPFSSFDYNLKITLAEKLYEITRKLNLTTIMINHSLDESIYLSDKLYILSPAPSIVKKVIDCKFTKSDYKATITSNKFLNITKTAVQNIKTTEI